MPPTTQRFLFNPFHLIQLHPEALHCKSVICMYWSNRSPKSAVIMFKRPAKWGKVRRVFFSTKILIHWAILPRGTSWGTLDYLYSVYYIFLGHLSPISWLLRRIAEAASGASGSPVLGWTFLNHKREGSAPDSWRWGESQASDADLKITVYTQEERLSVRRQMHWIFVIGRIRRR